MKEEIFVCPECKTEMPWQYGNHNFCPFCGVCLRGNPDEKGNVPPLDTVSVSVETTQMGQNPSFLDGSISGWNLSAMITEEGITRFDSEGNPTFRSFDSPPVYIVIPARMNSGRFPGKVLHDFNGKTLLQRCYETACASQLADGIFVTTPDSEIFEEALKWMPADHIIKTPHQCRNGTERVAITCLKQRWIHDEIIVNLQGDQFGISSSGHFIDAPVRVVMSRPEVVATSMRDCDMSLAEVQDENVVKVLYKQVALGYAPLFAEDFEASGFYRTLPPCFFGVARAHLGVYVARAGRFVEYYSQPPTKAEKEQRLEQLRWKLPIYACSTGDRIATIDVPMSAGTLQGVRYAEGFAG